MIFLYYGLFASFLAVCILLWKIFKALGTVSAQLEEISRHLLSGRPRQSKVARKTGPKIETAKQIGPRHPGARGAREARGLRFKRVGGEHVDSDDAGDRLQWPG